ncbi:ATP-binding protein [Leisingera aquaemixtae]|uniref:ATP-binding protein n=1 Tax=Leisingera aquaemixtae TaxID=1396826 RepID=UPI0021A41021|nr:ATP-binding protein [Leisingera aquaemixtae]UWQ44945.1 response regulator [Leisingera aquaemixtae]
MPALSRLSVRFRLSAAIAVLFGLILLVSLIGMRVLNRTELWMNVLHQDTLTEVSDALDLSRRAAGLATSAPFLYALFPPFQLEQEAQKVRDNLRRLEQHAASDQALDLPLARLRLAIDDLTAALVPQTARKAALTAIGRDMLRLNQRVRRLAGDTSLPLAEREIWAGLQQLTASAIGAARATALIELGEHTRLYTAARDQIEPRLLPAHRAAFDEIQQALIRSGSLFVLKHREIAAQLDAENALFRIRQETGRITAYAEEKVAQAEARLSQARAETSNNLGIAKNSFFALTLISLLVAVTSALYVSRYVARNLRRVADAMRRLAAGDHRSDLPRARAGEDEIGQLFAAFQVFRDNARKLDRRTGEIRRQNALFSRVFRNIKDGVAITSASGRIEAENDNLRTLLRLPREDSSLAEGMQALIARSPFIRQASAGERGGFEEYADASGHVLELRHSPLPDGGAVWLLSETTERKRIEERLEEIRRVETLGKVTGEVAHDFGNILSSISGNLHLLEGADTDQSRHFRARIRSAVDLGVSLTERLLAFARKQHLEPQATDIGMLIDAMADLLEIALPDTVSLEFERPAAAVFARVDPGQLESAVLNLCVNAGQAISGPGTIRISVATGEDGAAHVSLQDNGCGMPPEVLRRATEPFFTNRNDGNGTGLGLSMVDGFVHQSGGHLTIASRTEQPHRGTTVTMAFPPLTEEASPCARSLPPGTALVVDDDPASLAAAASTLERLGYVPLRAASFSEAAAQVRQQRKLDLVLSDLNLDDGASGWDLLQMAHSLHPGCRLVLMSTREATRTPSALRGVSRLATLTKPVSERMMRDLLAPG